MSKDNTVANPPKPPAKQTAPKPERWREITSLVFAGIILIGFTILIVFMWQLTGDSIKETQWSRAVFLFAAVEAITFTAIGFVFGREVNRERAANAEATAKDAQQQAQDASQEGADAKAKAKALKDAIKAKAGKQASASGGRVPEMAGGGLGGDPSQDLAELAAFADALID